MSVVAHREVYVCVCACMINYSVDRLTHNTEGVDIYEARNSVTWGAGSIHGANGIDYCPIGGGGGQRSGNAPENSRNFMIN